MAKGSGVRYLIYQQEKGIFLGLTKDGDVCWSKQSPGIYTWAMTFARKEAALEYAQEKELGVGIEYKEVWADVVGLYASKTAIANACLPVW